MEMWPKETEDVVCATWHNQLSVPNQLECQELCTANEACVGISYSAKKGKCRRCEDDKLTSNDESYDFFRRPG